MKFFRFWFPVILYSGIIFYVSSWPNLNAPLSGWNFDKVLHVLEYLPFGFLVGRALRQEGIPGQIWWWNTILVCLLYGISDEFHQSFVAGRSSAVSDIAMDVLGSSIGAWLYFTMMLKLRLRKG